MSQTSGQSKRQAAVRVALQRARAAGQEQTVVFHLRGAKAASPPSSTETEQLAQGVIRKVVGQCGLEPKRKTVFENLGAMAVEGDAELLLKILEQPEVQDASLNGPQASALEPIRPVRKGPATSSGFVDS